jgi:hypothetical protein
MSALANIAATLGVPVDTTEKQFRALSVEYRIDAAVEARLGNHAAASTLRELAELAAHGARMVRGIEAERVWSLLVRAAEEVIPVGARAFLVAEGGMWSVAVQHSTGQVVRAVHGDLLTAVRMAGRALLAREGATGPACDALRAEVGQ